MPGISQEQAQKKLDMYMEILDNIGGKKSYTINNRSYTYADISEVRDQIAYWEKKVIKASRGGVRVRGGVPGGF